MPEAVLLMDPVDLATRLGVLADDPRLLVACRAASARFRGAVRWQVHRVTNETLVVNAPGTRTLRLPVRCVEAVIEARLGGEPIAVEWDADGLLERADGYIWPRMRRAVEVTLTYGYDPIPDDIAAAVADQAEVAYNIVRGLSSKQVGGITLTYGQGEALGTSAAWADAVTAYRVGGRA